MATPTHSPKAMMTGLLKVTATSLANSMGNETVKPKGCCSDSTKATAMPMNLVIVKNSDCWMVNY